jgi:hypothetical protein
MSESKEDLQSLHTELAKVLKKHVSKSYMDDDGNELPPPAAILNVARQFLKDNNIDGVPTEGTPLAQLAQRLPFSDSPDVH